jgi:hypothetical protein
MELHYFDTHPYYLIFIIFKLKYKLPTELFLKIIYSYRSLCHPVIQHLYKRTEPIFKIINNISELEIERYSHPCIIHTPKYKNLLIQCYEPQFYRMGGLADHNAINHIDHPTNRVPSIFDITEHEPNIFLSKVEFVDTSKDISDMFSTIKQDSVFTRPLDGAKPFYEKHLKQIIYCKHIPKREFGEIFYNFYDLIDSPDYMYDKINNIALWNLGLHFKHKMVSPLVFSDFKDSIYTIYSDMLLNIYFIIDKESDNPEFVQFPFTDDLFYDIKEDGSPYQLPLIKYLKNNNYISFVEYYTIAVKILDTFDPSYRADIGIF